MASVTQMSFQSKEPAGSPGPFLRNDRPAGILSGSFSFPAITNYNSRRAEVFRTRTSILDYQSFSVPSALSCWNPVFSHLTDFTFRKPLISPLRTALHIKKNIFLAVQHRASIQSEAAQKTQSDTLTLTPTTKPNSLSINDIHE